MIMLCYDVHLRGVKLLTLKTANQNREIPQIKGEKNQIPSGSLVIFA